MPPPTDSKTFGNVHLTDSSIPQRCGRLISTPTGGVLFICVRAATLLSDIEQRSSYVLVQQHGQYGDQCALYYV